MGRVEIPHTAQNSSTGEALAGVSMTVKKRSDGTNATVYSGETGAGTVSNPIISDANGRFAGYLDPGRYQLDMVSGAASWPEYFDAAQGTERVTTLPASPTDGQEVYYEADSADSIVWHVRWNAANSIWELPGGGTPLSHATPVDSTAAGTALPAPVGSVALVDSITIPRAGYYFVDYWATIRMHTGTTSAYAAIFKNGTLQTTTRKASQVDSGPTEKGGLWKVPVGSAFSAGDVIALGVWCDTAAANAKYWGSSLLVIPKYLI